MICRSLKWVLTKYGYAVATALSGAEALATFQQQRGKVRLVMTDLMMPTMSGAELIRVLHAQDPTIPIIAFTGVINPEVRAELEAVGVDCILMKPCDPREILCAVSQQLSAAE
jgi:CheY-like chemotaxis protein